MYTLVALDLFVHFQEKLELLQKKLCTLRKKEFFIVTIAIMTAIKMTIMITTITRVACPNDIFDIRLQN